MAFSSTNNVSVGTFTKKSHYDQLLDNTTALNTGLNGAIIKYASRLTSANYTVTGSMADIDPASGEDFIFTGSPPTGLYLLIAAIRVDAVAVAPDDAFVALQIYHSGGTTNSIGGNFLALSALVGIDAFRTTMTAVYPFTTTTTGDIKIQAQYGSGSTGTILSGSTAMLCNFFTSL